MNLYVYIPIFLIHFPFHPESSTTGHQQKIFLASCHVTTIPSSHVWRGWEKWYLEQVVKKRSVAIRAVNFPLDFTLIGNMATYTKLKRNRIVFTGHSHLNTYWNTCTWFNPIYKTLLIPFLFYLPLIFITFKCWRVGVDRK